MKRIVRQLTVTCSALMGGFAVAPAMSQPAWVQPDRPPGTFTLGELAILPDYCKDVQGIYYGDATNPSPRAAYWIGMMGKDFWHTHHYCRAIAFARRATAVGLRPTERSALRLRAAADYDYMLINGSQANPLMPEIMLRYGELLLETNDMPRAKEMWDSARKLKPDYWPAYVRWIDVLMGLKLYDQALGLTREGLSFTPGNPELKRLETELLKRHGAKAPVKGTVAAASAAESR